MLIPGVALDAAGGPCLWQRLCHHGPGRHQPLSFLQQTAMTAEAILMIGFLEKPYRFDVGFGFLNRGCPIMAAGRRTIAHRAFSIPRVMAGVTGVAKVYGMGECHRRTPRHHAPRGRQSQCPHRHKDGIHGFCV